MVKLVLKMQKMPSYFRISLTYKYIRDESRTKKFACSSILSTAKALVSVSFPLQTGQGFPLALICSLQGLQSSCPFSHWNTGGSLIVFRHTGHSSVSARSSGSDKLAFSFFAWDAMAVDLEPSCRESERNGYQLVLGTEFTELSWHGGTFSKLVQFYKILFIRLFLQATQRLGPMLVRILHLLPFQVTFAFRQCYLHLVSFQD